MASSDALSTADTGARQRGPMADRILKAAVQLFYDQGYPQTSVREITTACGITPGALYNHFSSKEELLWVLVDSTHRRSEVLIAVALERAGDDPVAQLRELVYAMTVMHSTNRLAAIVSRNEGRRLPPAQARAAYESQKRTRKTFEEVLQRGVDADAFKLTSPDARPPHIPVIAKAILDMCIHCGLWFSDDGPLSTDALAEQYVALILPMVGADPRGGK